MSYPLSRVVVVTALAVCFCLFCGTAIPVQADTIDSAAVWLIGQQDTSAGSTDGAFPWTPGGGYFANTQGATALGLISAYEFTNNAGYLNAATANGDFIIGGYGGLSNSTWGNGDPRFATHDPLFLESLSNASGNPAYATYLQTWFWDRLSASTYSPNNYNAAGYGAAVVSNRDTQGLIELAAWDLSKAAIAAYVANEVIARDAFMVSVVDALEMTSVADTDFDLHGLAGAIYASAVTGIDLDPASGRFASADSTTDLVNELLNFQAFNGGFVFNSTADINVGENASTQVTAFAILALHAQDPLLHANEIDNALQYLRDVQTGSGQFLNSPIAASNAAGGVETHGEALHAFATAIPEPGMAWSGFGFILMVALRRRRSRSNPNRK